MSETLRPAPLIAVVVPCFNEEGALPDTLANGLRAWRWQFELTRNA